MIHNVYSHEEENLRVVDTGKSKFKIVREAQGSGLWHIETDAGPLPAQFRQKQYTRHSFAFNEIQNYLNGHAERSVVYTPKKKTDKTEVNQTQE